jgi:hypothetical protein
MPSNIYTPTAPKPEGMPPSHSHAWDALRSNGHRITRILHVSPDSIFYQRQDGKHMTAWLFHRKGKLEMNVEEGFPAEPSPGMVPLDADINLPPDPT